jgi:predicted aspartyl protease
MQLLSYQLPYKEFTGIDETTGQEVTRSYPLLPVKFRSGEKTTREVDGLLDSGSDGVVIPLSTAEYLGLKLTEDSHPMNVVGRTVRQYKSKIDIIIGRGGRYTTISDNVVSIPTEGDTPILLGRNPVFELYKILFIEAEKRFTMEPYIKKQM